MAKYIYPAVFTPEENGFFIDFPDFNSCFTQSKSLSEGLDMAKDVLSLMLTHFEDKCQKVPMPSAIGDLLIEDDSFAAYISCDTGTYRHVTNSPTILQSYFPADS